MTAALRPRDGLLHVVRWVRADGHSVEHQYYRRRRDAERRRDTLLGRGLTAEAFTTTARWEEATW